MACDHEDHSDIDSLFGDDELDDEESQDTQTPRPVISFPRAAAVSQNVGTIAPFPVPSSSEHTSSGSISSASIPLTRNSVEPHSRPEARGKRNASPPAAQPNKKRRVESNDSASSMNLRTARKPVDASGLPTSAERVPTTEVLQAARNLLAPRTGPSRSRHKATKPSRKPAPITAVVSGTGSAVDPVVIPDDNSGSVSSSVQIPSTQNAAQASTSRRLTRSQEAHTLLEALPADPTDVLSQTLRTILKTPTTISHSRNHTPRDIAVYLANGRYTGTPFLRLLRHLAGPNRLKDAKAGLEQLKKLVEAMRMTEEASKPVAASQSSAASTPMPVTPDTPSLTAFPAAETSTILHPSGLGFELDPFTYPGFSFDTEVGAPVDINKTPQPPSDIVIDPQLLALEHDPSYTQPVPNDAQGLDLSLDELLGALPPPPIPVPGVDLPTGAIGSTEAMDLIGWDELCNLPLDLDAWSSIPVSPTSVVPLVQPAVAPFQAAAQFQRPFTSATQITQRVPKQSDLPPGGIRVPTRTEASALLERARARKAELQAKIKSARRQAWGCMVEAAVERNLLGKLRERGVGDNAFND
ncbi:hypothetical protein FRC12_020993 [Ceratobasidium sp. 428]|nr:hypothetical protein FRC12_020993 [Ceratobasidium sp. 428]